MRHRFSSFSTDKNRSNSNVSFREEQFKEKTEKEREILVYLDEIAEKNGEDGSSEKERENRNEELNARNPRRSEF